MSRRILLADDSLTIQKVVELTFADTEYEVIAVSSGDDLLRRLPECSPDVVICDVIMPGRDGYDVCHDIKSNPDFLHLPVILLTGTFEPFDRDRALAAGCSEIVTKPFEARKLLEAVERLASDDGPRQEASRQIDDEPFEEGRVTPPPPIMPPEELDEVASFADLNDAGEQAEDAFPEDLGGDETAAAQEEAEVEALDFSTSGFLEMETAGLEKRKARLEESPSEGLEFEPGLEEESNDAGGADDPFLDGGGRAAGFAAGAARESQPPASPPTEPDFEAPAPDGPFAGPDAGASGEPFPDAGDKPAPTTDDIGGRDTDSGTTTPIDVAAAISGAAAAAGPDLQSVDEIPSETDLANADTQDFAVDVPDPSETAGVPAGDDAEAPGLSDEDVDRIARRVVELSAHLIEQIVWEVVPDMAEIVVRERVTEIEAEAERNPS